MDYIKYEVRKNKLFIAWSTKLPFSDCANIFSTYVDNENPRSNNREKSIIGLKTLQTLDIEHVEPPIQGKLVNTFDSSVALQNPDTPNDSGIFEFPDAKSALDGSRRSDVSAFFVNLALKNYRFGWTGPRYRFDDRDESNAEIQTEIADPAYLKTIGRIALQTADPDLIQSTTFPVPVSENGKVIRQQDLFDHKIEV